MSTSPARKQRRLAEKVKAEKSAEDELAERAAKERTERHLQADRELQLICEKYSVLLIGRPVINEDGRIGCRHIWVDSKKT